MYDQIDPYFILLSVNNPYATEEIKNIGVMYRLFFEDKEEYAIRNFFLVFDKNDFEDNIEKIYNAILPKSLE